MGGEVRWQIGGTRRGNGREPDGAKKWNPGGPDGRGGRESQGTGEPDVSYCGGGGAGGSWWDRRVIWHGVVVGAGGGWQGVRWGRGSWGKDCQMSVTGVVRWQEGGRGMSLRCWDSQRPYQGERGSQRPDGAARARWGGGTGGKMVGVGHWGGYQTGGGVSDRDGVPVRNGVPDRGGVPVIGWDTRHRWGSK